MKQSVRGHIYGMSVMQVMMLTIELDIWRINLEMSEEEEPAVTFEIWLESAVERASLFTALKPYVVAGSGSVISWHECTHDELIPQPCVLAEVYEG